MPDKRIRTLKASMHVRQVNGAKVIEGHAALFNELSEPLWELGGARERIKPGAFRRAVEQDDVRALINHDSNLIIGRNTAGTLMLKEDERGLFYSVKLPNVSYARDLVESMRRGDVNQNSFQFTVDEGAWARENAEDIFEVAAVHLFDVSVVTFPAYVQTEAELRQISRALAAEQPTEDDRMLVKSFMSERCAPFCEPLNRNVNEPNECSRQAARAHRERELQILELEG